MARMSPRNSSDLSPLMKGWFSAHESIVKKQNDVKRNEMNDFINFLWPAGLDYSSPLKPVFLSEYVRGSGQQRMCLARDGLVPLLWFFETHPKPPSSMMQLFVHKDLAPFVPNAWRRNAGTYELVSLRNEDGAGHRKPVRQLFLGGVFMDTFCSSEGLDAFIDKIEALVPKVELSKAEITLFLPPRLSGFGNEHLHDFHLNFMIQICKRLGTQMRSLNWRSFEAIPSLQGVDWLELNENLLCADSFLSHSALRRGARLLGENEKNESNSSKESGEEIVRLSPYHGMSINLKLSGKSILEEGSTEGKEFQIIKSQFEKAMRSEANRRFPWPDWFQSWASDAKKLKS